MDFSHSHSGLEYILARIIQDFMRFMRQTGLSTPQIHALLHIYHSQNAECQLSEIGGLADSSKPAASQLVERLLQQGLVERTEDPLDRRNKKLRLTEKSLGLIQNGLTSNHFLVDLMTSLLPNSVKPSMRPLATLRRQVNRFNLPIHKRMASMHRMHNEPKTGNGPETSGLTLHWAAHYDFFSRLMGLGVNRPNSRMVIELAKVKPGDKVLDVGCGTGSLTLTAKASAGASGAVYGIDASPEMIDVARKKALQAGSDVVFDVGLIEKIPFPDATFDVVVSRLVIHHLPDDLKRKAFAEIFRVLKPGGHFLVADLPPTNPLLNHVTSALVGRRMMQTDVSSIPPLFPAAGFVEVTSGPTRSAFLAYVSGKKPAQ
jgi:demethylmenaquinone methyltransferase/2-methoxy-6-polyprenyl-1,4-benzoquinol methylase/phosphoethanolamine N-methyltransferase